MTDDSVPMAPVARGSWRWRGAAWVATLAGVMALAYVIAHWGWHWLLPRPPAAVPGETPDRWAPAILASPLFGRAGASAAAPAATTDEPATLQGDTRLLGVFAASDGTGHALFRLGARGSVLVRSGEQIASDVTLVEVRPDGVRIRDHGEIRSLGLRAQAAAPRTSAVRGAPSLSCATPPGYKGPVYRLNAELLTGIATRPDGWRALLTPVAGGLAVREGSAAASMLGLKPGDRVAQANGIALAGIDDIMVAFVKPLVASEPVHVAGIRDGKPAAWLFLNAGACPG
jgi:hypothetical protein